MHSAYVVTDTLTDTRTVTLDEALPLMPTKIRLVIESLTPTPQRSYQEVIAHIRAQQRARGDQPPTREEGNVYLQAERENWGE